MTRLICFSIIPNILTGLNHFTDFYHSVLFLFVWSFRKKVFFFQLKERSINSESWKDPSWSPFCLSAQVVISDGGPNPRQSTVLVIVQVLDENDNKPTFHEKVYKVKLPERERRKKAEPIYRVFAYDLDEGPNSDISYSIVDGNDDGKFVIDPKTGTVQSRRAFPAGGYDILTVRGYKHSWSFWAT